MNGHNETLEELSQIWLHALAARAGFAYERSGRPMDNLGVDATVHTGNAPLAPDATAASFPIEFQLNPVPQPQGIPVRLRRLEYDRLRLPLRREPLLLAAVYFPTDPASWLIESPTGLVLQGQAYWANLKGAPESTNEVHQTVYLPTANRLTVEGLRDLAVRLSRGELQRRTTS